MKKKKKNEAEKKYFVVCYTPWLKDAIYAVTNISITNSSENSFSFRSNSMTQFNNKKQRSKTSILMNITKTLVIIAINLYMD